MADVAGTNSDIQAQLRRVRAVLDQSVDVWNDVDAGDDGDAMDEELGGWVWAWD